MHEMPDLDSQLRAALKLAKQNGQHRLYKVCIRMKRNRMKNAQLSANSKGA